MQLKRLLKPLVPQPLMALRNRFLTARLNAHFATRGPQEVFEAVYKRRLWGSSDAGDYYSGPGSHEQDIVAPYVESITRFIATLPVKPDVVDLGCGDFNIGSRIRPSCATYVACDVVPGLIERNRNCFRDAQVNFRVVDISQDALPDGDLVFIRQVLQHMSNRQIGQLLPKLRKYKWVVITEHLPTSLAFTPNIDKPAGPTIRLTYDSGVVLEQPPFEMPHIARHDLCEVVAGGGRIVTVAYQMPG